MLWFVVATLIRVEKEVVLEMVTVMGSSKVAQISLAAKEKMAAAIITEANFSFFG